MQVIIVVIASDFQMMVQQWLLVHTVMMGMEVTADMSGFLASLVIIGRRKEEILTAKMHGILMDIVYQFRVMEQQWLLVHPVMMGMEVTADISGFSASLVIVGRRKEEIL